MTSTDGRAGVGLLAALLVSVLGTHFTGAAGVLDTAIVLAITAAIAVYYVYRHRSLSLPVWWTAAFALFVALLIGQLALGRFATWKLAIKPLYAPAVAAVALFLVPRLVSFRTLARLTAAIAIGLFALGTAVWLTGLDGGLAMFDSGTGNRSVFAAANIIAIVGVVGSVGTLWLFDRDRRPLDGALAIGAGAFTFSTFSRGAILALVVAVGVYVVDTRGSRRLVGGAIAAGALAIAAGIAGIIVAPQELVATLPLSYRQWLWRATWQAIAETPTTLLTGVGMVLPKEYIAPLLPPWIVEPHGPHNAYLLVWLRAGVVAFVAYIALVWGLVVVALRRDASPALLSLLVAFGVDSAVAQFTLVSPSIRGVLFAIVCGYVLREVADRQWTADFTAAKRWAGMASGRERPSD